MIYRIQQEIILANSDRKSSYWVTTSISREIPFMALILSSNIHWRQINMTILEILTVKVPNEIAADDIINFLKIFFR